MSEKCNVNKRLILFITLAIFLLLPTAPQAQAKKRIALLDFENLGGLNTFTMMGLMMGDKDALPKKLTRGVEVRLNGSYEIYERVKLESLLQEQNLGTSGRIDWETAARTGKLRGVNFLVLGSITSIYAPEPSSKKSRDKPQNVEVRANFRLLDTTTGRQMLAREIVGQSGKTVVEETPNVEKKPEKTKSEKAGRIIGGILGISTSTATPTRAEPEDKEITMNEINRLIDEALVDAANQIAFLIDDQAKKDQPGSGENSGGLQGKVMRVTGSNLVVTGLDNARVRRGSIARIRRLQKDTDPISGKLIQFTDDLGEAEVIEIQPEVVILRYTGQVAAQKGDLVVLQN